MTIVDKVIDALTPRESDPDRMEARRRAVDLARPGSWLALVLEHHLQIEAAFAAARDALSEPARTTARKQLAVVLTGHSMAEEGVIYPALSAVVGKADAESAYLEQSTAKQEMAALEILDPMSLEYLEKLEEIRAAVAHHVYEEESQWFIKLQQQADSHTHDRLSMRYREEFERYVREAEPQGNDAGNAEGSYRGTREAGGYSGSLDQSQRGGLPPLAGVEGGTYGGLRNEPDSDLPRS